MRRLIAAIGFCAMTTLSLILLFPRVADAAPCQVEDTYFYDSSCSTVVGHQYVNCAGVCQNCWGDHTYVNYKVYNYCCGNPSCDVQGLGCGPAGYSGCFFEGACTSC